MRPSHHLCLLVSSIPHSYAAITDRPSHDSSSASPSRKRSRYPAASVQLSSPIPGALSYAHANLLPSPKRIRSSNFVRDLEDNYTPASPDYSPASDTESDLSEDPSSDHIPLLPATSAYLSSTDDSSNSNIPDTPLSPTHGTPFTETTLSTQRSPVACRSFRRRVMVLAPRKRVGPLPTHPLAVRHSVDYSYLDHFASNDSSRDSLNSLSPSSSSETLSDPSSDDLFDPSSDHSLPAPSSALSYAHANLLPSPKRIRSSNFVRDLEDSSVERFELSRSRETEFEIYVNVVRSDGIDINLEIQAEIDECIAYANALRDRGIDARVIVEAVDQDEIETGTRGSVEVRVDRVIHLVTANDIPKLAQDEGAIEVTYETFRDLVQRFHDHTIEISVHCVQAIEGIQRDQGYRIVVTGQQSTDMLERIRGLKRVNMRLRDMMDVAS
uniref:Uncharacterized protein n=1 Tax=Tanacetum cinerariifolium TaxID=118510 RepID=A0A699HTQ6_TANCI|nr:hypothetical protein [Tanacetum cinerariifolium]